MDNIEKFFLLEAISSPIFVLKKYFFVSYCIIMSSIMSCSYNLLFRLYNKPFCSFCEFLMLVFYFTQRDHENERCISLLQSEFKFCFLYASFQPKYVYHTNICKPNFKYSNFQQIFKLIRTLWTHNKKKLSSLL